MAYLRFQTSVRCRDTGFPSGVFTIAGHVQSAADLPSPFSDYLEETLDWFNEHLVVPSWRLIPARAQFWYRADSQQFVARMWDFVWLLRESGIRVTLLKTSTPGQIIYRDDHQVAAIPDRRVGFRR